jgi:O-antigen ligase
LIGSRGALLGYLVFILSYGLGYYNTMTGLMLYSLLIMVGIIASMYFNTYDGELSRLELIRNSINLWKESPLLGCGAGNWNIDILKYGLDYDNSLNSPVKTSNTVLSHNLHFKILAELGVLGSALFSMIILYPIVKLLRKGMLNSFKRASLYSILLFVFFSNIYTFCNLTKFDFSGHLICFFLIFGIIISDE